MSVLKQYNTGTSTWDTIVVGQQGQPGVQTGSVAPTNTNILWMDTADAGSQVAVPSGGNPGQVLAKSSATDYATNWVDTTQTAGKNILINGAFDIWQRGTSFTSTGYSADRWYSPNTGIALTQETSDLPTGFQYGAKWVTTGASQFAQWNQPIETAAVIPLRGQTVTVSGYIKISGSYSGNWISQANYSTSSDSYASQTTLVPGSSKVVATSATTAWTRFTNTFTIPSNAVGLRIDNIPDVAQGSGVTVRITGLQLEVGSVATPFSRAAGTIQGELAACQRYYYRFGGLVAYTTFGLGIAATTTVPKFMINHPTTMRVSPTSVEFANLQAFDSNTGLAPVSGLAINAGQTDTHTAWIEGTSSGLTQYRPYALIANGTSGYLGFSAEL